MAQQNEATFRGNVRSPRYSTGRALGFAGGSSAANGNLTPPSAQNVAGSAPPVTPAAPGGLPTSLSSPRPASSSNLVGTVGSALLGKGAEKLAGSAYDAGVKAFGNAGSSVANDYLGDQLVNPADFPATSADFAGANAASAGEAAGTDAAIGDAGGEAVAEGAAGDALAGAGAEGAADAGIGLGAAAEGAADVGAGAAVAEGAGAAAEAAGGFELADLGALALCFITQAVMSQQGKDDNAPELQMLRWFRDNIMMQTDDGEAMVEEYDKIAPIIVSAIDQRPDAQQVYSMIYDQFILPACEAIQSGDNKGALEIYAKMVAFAASYSQELMDDDSAELADGLGDFAAGVAHDDQTTAAVSMGQGSGDTDWADDDPGASSGPDGDQDADDNEFYGAGAGYSPQPPQAPQAPQMQQQPYPAIAGMTAQRRY